MLAPKDLAVSSLAGKHAGVSPIRQGQISEHTCRLVNTLRLVYLLYVLPIAEPVIFETGSVYWMHFIQNN